MTELSRGDHRPAYAFASGSVENHLTLLLIALVAFALPLTCFTFRFLDDNRLVSWRWLFDGADMPRIATLSVGATAVAFVLRKIALPPRGAAVWLFGFSFAAGAAFWSEPEVVVDAARYFSQARYLALHGIGSFAAAWGGPLPAWTDLPLVPFLYGLIFRLAGEDRVHVQIFTTLLFSGTVVLTYRIGRELWDETIGFYGAALLLGMPYLLTQVPLMLVDVPAMFFIALATFAAIRAFKLGGAHRIAAAVAAITLAVLSKYSAWMALTVLVPIAFVYAREAPEMALRRAAVITGSAAAVAGLVALTKHGVLMEQFRLLWDYQRPGLGRWQESFVSTFLFHIHPFITAAAACSLYAAIRKKDLKYAIIGWLLVLVLLGQIGRIRYLIVFFPMLALMAAYGMREIRSSEARAFALLCALLSSLGLALFAYLPFLKSTSAANLQRAGAYLDNIDARQVEVIALEQARAGIHPAASVPLLDFYTRKALAYRPERVTLSPPAGIDISPLRFTWEYPLSAHYPGTATNPGNEAAVVILDSASRPYPPPVTERLQEHCLAAEFMATEGVFSYQTLVRIYQRPSRGAQPCLHGGAG